MSRGDVSRARVKNADLATRAVHVGERPERPEFTPVVTPIYPSSTFVYDDLEQMDAAFEGAEGKYVYSRYGNPTVTALESVLADLEGTAAAVSFSSGMAAVYAAIMTSVTPGDAIVASRDLYGATYDMLANALTEWGCTVEFVDILDLDTVAEAVERLSPALIVCEVISNPLLRVTDVPAVVKLARTVRSAVLVDSTFSPTIYSAAADGAQLVVHSITKYIGGHGDVLGGVVATTSMRREKLANFAKMTGPILGPFDAWLALRGIKTLPLRVRTQCQNAATIAAALSEHPLVSRVYYPGLPDHPSHETAQRLFADRGFGGVLAFEIKDGGRDEAFDFLEALKLVVPATSLGDVYTLALYPAMSSHRALTPEQRASVGIGEGLVRVSVGIESPADIFADIDQALNATSR